MSKHCLPCLREIEREGTRYSSVLKDIDSVLSKKTITSENVRGLAIKLGKCNLPLTNLGTTQLFAYQRALEDTNQPMDLIKKEIGRVKEYIEPAVEAAR